MIKTHSDDPDVATAAHQARDIVHDVLASLPPAETFDYGGHNMRLGEYNVCERCTRPIAESQQAARALEDKAADIEDETIREHLELAAELMRAEAAAAEIRAEFHNGHASEPIVNELLGFLHDREVRDSYDHSHNQGN